MTINRCEDYINHMAQAIHLALSYIDGLAFIDFLDDTCTQQACIMNVLIIGEVATKLMNEYPDFVAQHSEIEWRSMRGMRNRIAHGYFDIDLEVVGKLCKLHCLICKTKFKPFKIVKVSFQAA